jgi:zinc protease
VALQAHVEADRRFEPAAKAGLAALHGECLRSGTERRDALAIAETIEGVGGELATSATGIACKVRAGDVALALDLVADCLQRSTFPEAEVAKKRAEQVSRIQAQADEPQLLAALAARAGVYGDHPYGRPALGTVERCAALTRDDLVAWYRTRVVPANTLLVLVGDFDPAAVRAAITAQFGAWTGAAPAAAPLPAPAPQGAPRATYITRADDDQLNIYLMRLGVRRNHPDWYRLLVMDYILGRGPGFTDRLSKTLRDEQGLCYTVYSRIAETADVEPGVFEAYMGTAPRNLVQALYGIRMQIARMRDERVTDQELADAKAYLTGRFVFQFETREQLAAHLVDAERLGLPDDYLQTYADRIDAVTADEVRAVARRHLHPEHCTLAIAGPVDAEGYTLEPRK